MRTPLVIGAHFTPDRQRRLAMLLKGIVNVLHVDTGAELLRVAARGSITATIVPVRNEARCCLAPLVRALRYRVPSVTVILFLESSETATDDVVALVRAGIHAVLRDGDRSSSAAVLQKLRSAMMLSYSSYMVSRLPHGVSHEVKEIVSHCMNHITEATGVAVVAGMLGISRRTLNNRLRSTSVSPHVLIQRCRLLIACRMLQEQKRSAEQVALVLDYPSGCALRNAMRRYLGIAPGAARTPEALLALEERFLNGLTNCLSKERTQDLIASDSSVS